MEEDIVQALAALRAGGLILYPTDTVWGIGCDATNEAAVEKIYELKRSDDKHSMIVLAGHIDRIARYVGRVPEVAWQLLELADKPLTLILPGAAGVAPNLIPEQGTLGVRVPDHEFCRQLLRRFGKPIVSTSANISGRPTPAKGGEIAKEIIAGVDYIVASPASVGKMTGRPSSIIALGPGGEVKIVRE
ncbi:threonylcarbamoyl-AMP synthase [Bacteroidia bacterium]|nr:threonylcarbamoyl-AMP synthase [Bacteroidia bacterium]